MINQPTNRTAPNPLGTYDAVTRRGRDGAAPKPKTPARTGVNRATATSGPLWPDTLWIVSGLALSILLMLILIATSLLTQAAA